MAVFTFNDNIQLNAPKHIDTRYINLFTPWASTAAANAAIPMVYRYLGLTVLIGTVEYWYQSGVADINLVIKGGGGAGLLTADNGLTANTATNVRLGGTLVTNTTIAGGSFILTISGSDAINQALNVVNTSTGYGAQIQSNGGIGAYISSNTARALYLTISPVTTNTVSPIMTMFTGSTGTPAAGMGGSINYQLKNAASSIIDTSYIASVWDDPTAGVETSHIDFGNINLGFPNIAMTLYTNGELVINGTGTGVSTPNSSTGGFFTGTNAGVVGISSSVPMQALNSSTSTNTVQPTLQLGRQGSSFTGAIGNGVSILFLGKDTSNSASNIADISAKLTNVTPGGQSGQLDFHTWNAGTLQLSFSIKPNGTINITQPLGNYANNAAAITGGLTVGDIYRNGDVLMIVH